MATLRVRVTPGARESAIGDWREGVLRVRVREKAERGRANQAVVRLLADALGVRPSSVRLIHGAASREKMLAIEGLDDADIRKRLNAPVL